MKQQTAHLRVFELGWETQMGYELEEVTFSLLLKMGRELEDDKIELMELAVELRNLIK